MYSHEPNTFLLEKLFNVPTQKCVFYFKNLIFVNATHKPFSFTIYVKFRSHPLTARTKINLHSLKRCSSKAIFVQPLETTRLLLTKHRQWTCFSKGIKWDLWFVHNPLPGGFVCCVCALHLGQLYTWLTTTQCLTEGSEPTARRGKRKYLSMILTDGYF